MSGREALLKEDVAGVTQEGVYHALSDRREQAHEAERNSDGKQ